MIDEERLTSNDPEVAAAAAAAPASPHVLPPSYRHKRLLCAHFKQRATSSAGGGNQALPDIKAGESVATISPEKLAEISEVSGVRLLILAVLYQHCSLWPHSMFLIPAFLQVLATLRCRRLPPQQYPKPLTYHAGT